MDDTNAQPTPQLLTDIQFKVARKGYDPTEVDAFLERLSGAVAQMQDRLRQANAVAESAERRAADAERALSSLQARITELESGTVGSASSVSPEVEAEQAASVLAMAQRTADAVVNDARTSAAKLVSDAESEASNIVRDAQATAEASIGDLDARRRNLQADAVALEAFLAEQRASLSADVSRIQAVLDDPRALRVAPLPDSDAADSDAIDDDEQFAEPVVPSSDFPTMATPVVESTLVTRDDIAETTSDTAAGGATGAKLFDADADDDDENAQLFGATDDDADEAMRKFFDADFEDDDRFGR
jgi:cell division initiation protein